MSIVADTRVNVESPNADQCSHSWCQDHPGSSLLSKDIHSKTFVHGAIRFDFVLDERPDARARTYINWTDAFEEEFTPNQLNELNEIAAAIIVGKAAFEKFVTEVSK